MFRVGCCGFATRRKGYFSHFRVVEVQQTFYKPPLRATAVRWREEAAEDFEFTLKVWQLITHPPSSPTYRRAGIEIPVGRDGAYGLFRPTEEVRAAWERTLEIALALRTRVVVFQCPPRFGETPENKDNLRRFFNGLERGDMLLVWEPRGDWSDAGIRGLCRKLDLIHGVDPIEKAPLHGEPKYFRLHGGPGYRHTYSDEELLGLAEAWRGEEAYFMFNNITMYHDALRFMSLVEALG